MTTDTAVTSRAARPFLKWAGGKGQLLPALLQRRPLRFGEYFEPFIGGGALFLALHNSGRLGPAHLSDANPRLVETYCAVRDRVESVIEHLSSLANDAGVYYDVRAWQHADLPPALAAARIIYLNKTCYNGLYRENRRGEFNVPFGRYANPRICDAENLRAVSNALGASAITVADFEAGLESVGAGDFVYLDPPYQPLSRTSSFTSYHANGFGEDQQRRLARVYRRLSDRGAKLMLSNSDTPLIRDLYAGFRVDVVMAARAINSKGGGRGKVAELIVRNYEGDA